MNKLNIWRNDPVKCIEEFFGYKLSEQGKSLINKLVGGKSAKGDGKPKTKKPIILYPGGHGLVRRKNEN